MSSVHAAAEFSSEKTRPTVVVDLLLLCCCLSTSVQEHLYPKRASARSAPNPANKLIGGSVQYQPATAVHNSSDSKIVMLPVMVDPIGGVESNVCLSGNPAKLLYYLDLVYCLICCQSELSAINRPFVALFSLVRMLLLDCCFLCCTVLLLFLCSY